LINRQQAPILQMRLHKRKLIRRRKLKRML
jgi:hypothetical protein